MANIYSINYMLKYYDIYFFNLHFCPRMSVILSKLRELMKVKNLHWYLLPRTD